ncbi:DUF1990 family protein [Rhodopirellula europaea]|uniref:Uncharacterized conserved protein UCP010260 n=1 Tax=Rhodopirellula europaea 6C TaxID=1263867 RepID=M2B5D1_9BACT|nr:DUF1990 domain-containing protein [Rhodopirellula europaea]EMB17414.1 Uncharacterized conserved protein UCP010260 [Rhodopirellula europaea 6C]
MFTLAKPTHQQLLHRISQQSRSSFNYPDVGASQRAFPDGYEHHRHRVSLGNGREIFESAKAALENWRQFDVGWVEAFPANTAITVGNTIAIRVRIFGVWAVAFDRIVDVFDEQKENCHRFGYSVGTLMEHPEQGEERFLIEMDDDCKVDYEVAAFFRPNTLAAKIAWPILHRRFNRFRNQSAEALQLACAPVAAEYPIDG